MTSSSAMTASRSALTARLMITSSMPAQRISRQAPGASPSASFGSVRESASPPNGLRGLVDHVRAHRVLRSPTYKASFVTYLVLEHDDQPALRHDGSIELLP